MLIIQQTQNFNSQVQNVYTLVNNFMFDSAFTYDEEVLWR